MAFERLKHSLTKGNLWLYVLAELKSGDLSPGEIKERVQRKHGFTPASITFYSVLYRLRREGLVRRSSDSFRSSYSITQKGRSELTRAFGYIKEVNDSLAKS